MFEMRDDEKSEPTVIALRPDSHVRFRWKSRKLMLLMLGVSATTACAETQFRSWTPADSVAVRYFSGNMSNPSEWPRDRLSEDFVIASPDREAFFFVSHYGVLSRDSNVYEISIFEVEVPRSSMRSVRADARKQVEPAVTVAFETTSSREPALKDVVWSDDSSAVLFRKHDSNNVFQAYRLDRRSGVLKKLTDNPHGVADFTYRNGGLLFTSWIPRFDRKPDYPMIVADKSVSGGIAFDAERVSERVLYAASHDSGPTRISRRQTSGGWIAPDGVRAVTIDTAHAPFRFVLLNLEDGRVSQLLDSGVGSRTFRLGHGRSASEVSLPSPSVVWLNPNRPILVNTMLPATSDSPVSGTAYIVDFELDVGRWRIVSPMVSGHEGDSAEGIYYVRSVERGKGNREIVVTYGRPNSQPFARVYASRGDEWVGRATEVPSAKATALSGGLSVSVVQSANDPPKVVASDGNREMVLTLPDPALAGIWRATVETVRWPGENGEEDSGGLMMPRNFIRNTPVPLVIQAYFHFPRFFLPDGVGPSTYAAQALAAEGIAVLQVDIPHEAITAASAEEGPLFVARLDAAVASLERKGLIDASRVGVIGFSRAGYETLYALTHPGRTRLAAAICSDSFTRSYFEYLQNAASKGGPVRQWENPMGGSFWEQKARWLEHEPTFNMDRVQAPILLTIHGKGGISGTMYEIDVIGALARNNKPFEVIALPHGAHQLLRPRERMAEMAMAVEWMEYWLQGKPPRDAALAEKWGQLSTQLRKNWPASPSN